MINENKSQEKKDSIDIQMLLYISILSFSTIALLQHFMGKQDIYTIFTQNLMIIIFIIIILMGLLFIWNFTAQALKSRSTLFRMINVLLLFFVCAFTIVLTGGYLSPYKYFLILSTIAATIEGQMKFGIISSTISSIFLLTMDLIMYKNPNSSSTDAVNIYFENDLILTIVFFTVSYIIGYYISEKQSHIKDLESLIIVDEMTQLYNYRYFKDQIQILCDLAIEQGSCVSLIIIDLYCFKQYNDLFGHFKGNEILKKTGELIIESFSDGNNVCARYGGEEFAIILPNINDKNAFEMASNFCSKFEGYPFEGENYMPHGKLTISLGVASLPLHANDNSSLINKADEALYRAKFLRRNRTEIYMSFADEFKEYASGIENEDLLPTIKTLLAVINSKDKYTYMHTDRVYRYCGTFADYLKLSFSQKEQLVQAAYMHDIGKINISKDILLKEGPLEDEEMDEIKAHPTMGTDILKNMPSLKTVSNIIKQHHERYDGTGYPDGIKGKDINYLARILAIIDSYDAITSERPYKMSKSKENAKLELQRNAGTQFDPELVKVFLEFLDKYE